ncbi:MAG TPA: class I SAM-dependent methyltransferase [Anaeromyxobacteraceae bacterium]|nr:class I SAM-dependent methyltransferase [Anaeromyxobacteraceae bacterium]
MTDFDARARTWDADPQKALRAQRVADALAHRLPVLPHMTVLEYGSGTGLLGFALRGRAASLTLADSSAEMTAVAREKIAALDAGDVTAVRLDLTSDTSYATQHDLVCTLLTLHHVPDVPRLLRRFHGLVRPGGHVAVADLDAEDGSFHGEGFDGHNGFRREDIAAWLGRAGFSGIELQTVFEIEKDGRSGVRKYPVFLAIARRE